MAGAAKKKARYFYGWNIVAASFMAQLSYAEQHASVLGLFFRPLQSEFGWSRTALAAIQSIARGTEALTAPIVGPLIDRYGPRVLMPIGAVIVSLALLGITQINAIWQFYFFRSVIAAIGFTLLGNMVTDVTVSKWFVRRRGRAIAISRAGAQMSNIIMTPLAVFIIGASGWRTMFIIFAIVTLLVVIIPSSILMRRRPEDLGLYPDGIKPNVNEVGRHPEEKNPAGELSLQAEPIWNRREALVTPVFWLLAFAYAVDNMAFQGINISLAPYIQDLGYSDIMVAVITTSRSIIMIAVVPLVGFIAEHAYRPLFRATPLMIQGIGAFLFLLAGNPVFLWLAIVFYSLGLVADSATQEVVWANFFGRSTLGLVRSLSYPIVSGCAALGPLIMNAVFDFMGSYRPAFMVIIGLSAAASIVVGVVRPPTAKRYTTPNEMQSS